MTRRAFGMNLAGAASAALGWGQVAGAIEGKVQSETGKPVSNGTVYLDGQNRQLHLETRSNTDGQYFFENLVPGRYTLWCELAGHGCIVYPNISLEGGQRLHRDFRFSNRDGGCET